MKFEFNLLMVLLGIICLFCSSAAAVNTNYNYTTDDDFNKGNTTGLNVSEDQIQLSDNSSSSSFPFIWVPNSNEGTVSKVDTLTGLELARYKTSNLTYGNPSRTTVDLEGNCWVGNRNIGTAVKIGLLENGGYIDRNNNSIIETSRDMDGNGVIMNTKDPVTGNDIIEILPWGEDECVLYEIILIPGNEGTYIPGNYSGSYVNDYYTPGPRGLAIDSQNNIWIGTYGTQKYYYVNETTGQILKTINVTGHSPYGAVIDQYGILWSAGNKGNDILRLNPLNDSVTTISLSHIAYGLALDRNNHLFVSGLNYYSLTRINILTGLIEWTKAADYAQGLTVTDDGDVWSANNIQGTVTRYSNDGIIKARIIVGNTPSGVSVDNMGKIWAVDNGDEYIHRINPNTDQINSEGNIINGVELSKRITGGTHYGYSDMTGVLSNTITSNKGIWAVIHDSEVNNALWGQISWNSYEPQGTKITVRIRSSNDKINWSTWENVTNGILLNSTPRGRFLEIETILERFNGITSPILYDLTVRVLTADVTLTNTIDNPTPKVGDTVKFVTIVINKGPDSATNVQIHPVIPDGFTIEPPSKGYMDNNIWIINNLDPGEIVVLEVKGNITPELTSQLINYTATETHDEYDPNQVSTTTASLYVPFPNLELVTGTQNGKPTLFIRNNGPDYAFNIGVQTNLPNGASSTTSQGFYINGLWYVGSLSPGALASLNLIFQTTSTNTQINPVSGYKTTTKIVAKNKYSTKRGIIPPPNRKSVPMQDTGLPINFSAIAVLFIFFAAHLNKNNNKIRPNKWLALFLVLFFALLFIGNVNAADSEQTYNSTDDFNKGAYNNMNGSNNKLELPKSNNYAQNYIWVPNTDATISKVDVRTGQEVARYRTNSYIGASPSRTVVDNRGNCWVSNKVTGSLLKIGLYENGEYIDRNNNGKVETSTDKDYNGIITSDEILNWGQDECVLFETILIPGREGVYIPGEYNGGYANNLNGIGSLILDSSGNIWAGDGDNKKYYYINGSNGQIIKTIDISTYNHIPSSAVIDKNMIIWSAGNNLLRLDTITGSAAIIDPGYLVYSVALDKDDHIFIYGQSWDWWTYQSYLTRISITTGNLEWTKTLQYSSPTSLLISDDGDVWISQYYSGWPWWGPTSALYRYNHDGELKATILPGNAPKGLSIDYNRKIWVTDASDEYIHRIDPFISGVDLSKRLINVVHDATGTMTTPTTKNHDQGTWTITHDSQTDNAYWGIVSWNSYEPEGTGVSVHVRSSNDKTNWSNWEEAFNGANLSLTPAGRYLEVEVTLERTGTTSPIVYNLTIKNTDSTLLTADLGVTVTGDKNTLNIGDTVKLTIHAVNNGPNSVNVRVNYKIPFGLKLLSSQGQGTYDSSSNVWNAGTLSTGGNSTLELTLQAVNDGYFVNIFNVYGDLPVTYGVSTRSGMVRAWASSGFYDPNPTNNQGSYGLNSNTPSNPSNSNSIPYEFPPTIQLPTPSENPIIPPEVEPPDYGPLYPKDQLSRDIAGLRDAVSRGELNKSVLPEWAGNPSGENVNNSEYLSILADVAIDIVFLGAMATTPGSGEYLQQVKNGMVEAMDSLKMAINYFTKNPRYAFRILKDSFQQASNGFIDRTFMESLSKKTFPLDPNIAQEGLKIVLCNVFPKQADKISTLFGLFGSLNFLTHPLEILEAWGNVAYSFTADGIGQRDYNKVVGSFWEAIKETFTKPIPFGPSFVP